MGKSDVAGPHTNVYRMYFVGEIVLLASVTSIFTFCENEVFLGMI
jgi:hypothetical protein